MISLGATGMSNLKTDPTESGNLNPVPNNGSPGDMANAFEVPERKGSKYTDILLQRLQSDVFQQNKPKVIAVASFASGQGVTTTALNLAIRAADHRISPTLIIDGNFRNQKASRHFRTGRKGLSECLSGRSTLAQSVKPTKVDDLSVLGLGQQKSMRRLMVATEPMIEFLDELRDSYRLSIFDFPAMSEPSLADAFLPHLDGVLLVARYGSRKEKIRTLQKHVLDSGGKIVGTVMTGNESKLPKWLSRFF